MGRGPSIENRKNAEDARRAKLFTKLIREITVAARAGGDPAGNPRLRLAMDKAMSANMSKDTIERAIQRGTGELAGAQLEEVRYEGYGPGGAAILVECMTDNRTRTVGEVRHAFSRNGGNLGADGSVAYLFQRLGVIGYDAVEGSPQAEKILEAALEASAEDVVSGAGSTEVITRAEDLARVKQALVAAGLAPVRADLVLRAATRLAVDGAQSAALQELLDALESLDDVQHVYTNAQLPEAASA
ncbi:MAG TPA: YebC/PmpR family DNA-binding transcriptional regulator [Candidatus Binatia bacterium]|nr:YebC/PmpR family DNA-binding transcriptional regulator [Candidatus Binatia bacterium]